MKLLSLSAASVAAAGAALTIGGSTPVQAQTGGAGGALQGASGAVADVLPPLGVPSVAGLPAVPLTGGGGVLSVIGGLLPSAPLVPAPGSGGPLPVLPGVPGLPLPPAGGGAGSSGSPGLVEALVTSGTGVAGGLLTTTAGLATTLVPVVTGLVTGVVSTAGMLVETTIPLAAGIGTAALAEVNQLAAALL